MTKSVWCDCPRPLPIDDKDTGGPRCLKCGKHIKETR